MTTENDSSNGRHKFTLGEVLDISMVNSLYDALKLLLNEAKQVTIDAREVKRLDTAAMQLILCWYRESQAKNIEVSWQNTDGAFYDAAKMLGLAGELQLENA